MITALKFVVRFGHKPSKDIGEVGGMLGPTLRWTDWLPFRVVWIWSVYQSLICIAYD
jgi:hypothetical protein